MSARSPIPLRPDRTAISEDAAITIARAMVVAGRARISKQSINAVARNVYPGDHDVLLVLRAPTAPTDSTNASALVSRVVSDFVLSLTTVSAAASVFQRATRLRFNGAGQISAPSISGAKAKFVGESQSIPAIAMQTAAAILSPKKVASVVVLSREQIEGSNAEEVVRAALAQACGPALDDVLFSSAAASADAPAGLSSPEPLSRSAHSRSGSWLPPTIGMLSRGFRPLGRRRLDCSQ